MRAVLSAGAESGPVAGSQGESTPLLCEVKDGMRAVLSAGAESGPGAGSQERVVIRSEGVACAVAFNTRLRLPEVKVGAAALEDAATLSYLVTVRPGAAALPPHRSPHLQFVEGRVGESTGACDPVEACPSAAQPGRVDRPKQAVRCRSKDLVCPLCHYKCSVERYLRRHLSRCHKEYRPHRCSGCQYSFSTAAQLRLHASSSACSATSAPHPFRTGEEVGVEKPRSSFTCHHCHLVVKNKYNLERHIRLKHSYEGLLRCDRCDFRTTHSNFLRVHVDTVHLGLRPFRCRICDFTASHKHILTQHTRVVHLKVKRFECKECGLRCSTHSHLKRHVAALHLKYRPNSCPLCPYSTLQNYNLCLHLNRVHSRPLPTTRKRGGYHRKDEKLDRLVRRLESDCGCGSVKPEERRPPHLA